MQFTVLIEFLIPGIATVLLCLALLPAGALPPLPEQAPTGETATVLLLLAISYPVGHLVNFPVYVLFQRLLVPRTQRRIVQYYRANGTDLASLAKQQLGMDRASGLGSGTNEQRRELFRYMGAIAFSKNVERLGAHHVFHQGLQRLARGMLIPLFLAMPLVMRQHPTFRLSGVLVLTASCLVLLALLIHSTREEQDQIARFFVTLTSEEPALKIAVQSTEEALEPSLDVAHTSEAAPLVAADRAAATGEPMPGGAPKRSESI